jgi:hypothetical protein
MVMLERDGGYRKMVIWKSEGGRVTVSFRKSDEVSVTVTPIWRDGLPRHSFPQ